MDSLNIFRELPLSLPPKPFFSSPRNVIRVVAVVLLAAGTYGQFMLKREPARVAESTLYDVAMTFTTSAGSTPQRVQVRSGQTINVSAGTLQAAFVLTAADADTVKLEGGFGCDGARTATAPFIARLGAPTAIKAKAEEGAPPCALEMVVTKLEEVAPVK
jgi:hypothetical protein